MKKVTKIASSALLASSLAVGAIVPATAGQQLGQTNFDNGVGLPWHTCVTQPAELKFDVINDGGTHGNVYQVEIVNEGGKNAGGDSIWDAQFRHRKLSIIKGHKYTVKYDIWASKASTGNGYNVKVGDFAGSGDFEVWHNTMDEGSGKDFGAGWTKPTIGANTWTSFSATFTAKADVPAAEFAFHFGGAGEHNPQGAFGNGTILKFDNLSLVDDTATTNDWKAPVNPYDGGIHNAVRVNQVGYYTNLQKKATLVVADKDTKAYTFVVKKGNDTVYTGTSKSFGDDKDSGQFVHILDFSDLKETGDNFHIEVQGYTAAGYVANGSKGIGSTKSYDFAISDNLYEAGSNSSKRGVMTAAFPYVKDYASKKGLFTDAFNYFYQNRASIDISATYITSGVTVAGAPLARAGNPALDKAYVQKDWINAYAGDGSDVQKTNGEISAPNGWYDAGDHGKYVVNGGIAAWTLANVYERALKAGTTAKLNELVSIPEATGEKVLNEVKFELDFLEGMICKDKVSYQIWDVKANKDSGKKVSDPTNMVYHKLHDHKWTGLALKPGDVGPNGSKDWATTRIVKPVTTAATLNASACFAQAARLFSGTDAAKYLQLAKDTYAAAKANPEVYAPLDQARGGGAYGDNEVRDDFAWAAAELYATTGDATYKTDLETFKNVNGQNAYELVSLLTGGENNGSFTSFNWGNTAGLGTLSLYLNTKGFVDDTTMAKIKTSIAKTADDYLAEQAKQGYAIPYEGTDFTDDINAPGQKFNGYEWGSNSFVVNNAIVMAYAYDATEDVKYINGVVESMDYLLGRNALDFSYVTGYGSFHLVNPHHRYWSYENDAAFPLAPAGVLSGGPNAGMQDPYIKGAGIKNDPTFRNSQWYYIDSTEAWSVNEVTINWNAPLVWVVNYLDEVAPTVDDGITVPVDPGTKPTTTTTVTTTPKPTTTTATTTKGGDPITGDLLGDVDLNGEAAKVNDIVVLAKYLSNPDKFSLSDKAKANAQCDSRANAINTLDLLAIIKYSFGEIEALPVK